MTKEGAKPVGYIINQLTNINVSGRCSYEECSITSPSDKSNI